jgi:hypothetical protein
MLEMFFNENTDEVTEMKWNAVTFIDAMKMADRAWESGANFDVTKNILVNVVPSTPVKIVQQDVMKINNHDMYILWGMIEVNGVDFEVPIRFYALVEEFDRLSFEWTTQEYLQVINLADYVASIEDSEESKWGSLLGE